MAPQQVKEHQWQIQTLKKGPLLREHPKIRIQNEELIQLWVGPNKIRQVIKNCLKFRQSTKVIVKQKTNKIWCNFNRIQSKL